VFVASLLGLRSAPDHLSSVTIGLGLCRSCLIVVIAWYGVRHGEEAETLAGSNAAPPLSGCSRALVHRQAPLENGLAKLDADLVGRSCGAAITYIACLDQGAFICTNSNGREFGEGLMVLDARTRIGNVYTSHHSVHDFSAIIPPANSQRNVVGSPRSGAVLG